MHSTPLGLLTLFCLVHREEEKETFSSVTAELELKTLYKDKADEATAEASLGAKAKHETAGLARRCCAYTVDFFDLGLLSDPSTLNLLVGVSVASFAEMNFSIFVPFILAERGLDTANVANAMSVIAMANTVFRLLAPLLQALLGWSSKIMYILSLLLVVAGRTGGYLDTLELRSSSRPSL